MLLITNETRAEELSWSELQELNNCGHFLMVEVLLPRYRGSKYGGECDCTAGGFTSKPELTCYVPHPRGNWTLQELEGRADAVLLEIIKPPFGGCQIRFRQRGEKRHTMAGGNFVETCDSRFSQLYRYPCSVHDRHEG